MCYVIAKHVDKTGCVALKTSHGKRLVELKKEITNQIGFEKIQLVTLSRPSAYGEYEPYSFVQTEEEFKKAALAMHG